MKQCITVEKAFKSIFYKHFSYLPIIVMKKATKYDVMPIHTIESKNVTAFNWGLLRQSGIVAHNTKVMGHRNRNVHKLLSRRLQGSSANSENAIDTFIKL